MAHGDDAVGRFIDAIIESQAFRTDISSGKPDTIRAALKDKGINLPAPYDEQLVVACQAVTGGVGWPSLDQLRLALTETGGVHTLN